MATLNGIRNNLNELFDDVIRLREQHTQRVEAMGENSHYALVALKALRDAEYNLVKNLERAVSKVASTT